MVGGAITNLIFNVCLIPRFGAIGATIGTLAAEIVVLIIGIYFSRKQMPFIRIFTQNMEYVIPGLAMYVIVRKIAKIVNYVNICVQLLIMILVGGVLYIIGCCLIWRFRRNSMFHCYLKNKNK